jgi:hypothetical protein
MHNDASMQLHDGAHDHDRRSVPNPPADDVCISQYAILMLLTHGSCMIDTTSWNTFCGTCGAESQAWKIEFLYKDILQEWRAS